MNEVYEMNDILTIFGSFIVGIIAGFVIYHFALGNSKASTQQKEIDKTKAELEEYKAKVNSHFTNTASLMGEVASSYQSLYKHMADQSQDLLSDADLTPFPLLEKTPIENEEVEQADNTEKEPAEDETSSDINESDTPTLADDTEQSDSAEEVASTSGEVKDTSESLADENTDSDKKIADSVEEETDVSKDEDPKKTV